MEDITKEFPVLNYMVNSLNDRVRYRDIDKIFILKVWKDELEINIFIGYKEQPYNTKEVPVLRGVYSNRNNDTDNKIIEMWLCASFLNLALWGNPEPYKISLQELLSKKEN